MLAISSCILLIFLGVLPDGNTLKCFVCNSAHDENCASKSPPLQYLVECSYLTALPISQDGVSITFKLNQTTSKDKTTSGNKVEDVQNKDVYGMDTEFDRNSTPPAYTSCRKQDVTIPQQNNWGHIKPETRRIIRSCGWLETPKDTCKHISKDVILSQHCSCLRDACNKVGHFMSRSHSNFLITCFVVIFTILY